MKTKNFKDGNKAEDFAMMIHENGGIAFVKQNADFTYTVRYYNE